MFGLFHCFYPFPSHMYNFLKLHVINPQKLNWWIKNNVKLAISKLGFLFVVQDLLS